MPKNKEMLSEVLTYHLAPGVITSDKPADALMVLVKSHKLL
ncbi:hypothetical protein [Gelidibacter japonicus]|nr:hypothetical protein [Gelidibacter japonicus]